MDFKSDPKLFIRQLGGGLVLRHGSTQDADPLAEFNGANLGNDPQDAQRVAAMTRDLLTRPHAALSPGDFTIVEDQSTGRIVSSLCLISQTWSYDGIEFGLGRPEYVATDPAYRKRGLVRAQFDVIHQWSAERGQMVQGITGIPHFYRRFGYEYALALGGRRFGFEVPALKDNERELFALREAREEDIPFMMSVYEYGCRRSMIDARWPAAHWHNSLFEQSGQNVNRLCFRVIEGAEGGEAVGYLAHPGFIGMTGLNMFHYELKPRVSWLEVTPGVVRYLWDTGGQYAEAENRRRTSFGFVLGAQHPAYEALGGKLPHAPHPYAWYLRLPDPSSFLNHIRPVLERRLAESIAAGHSAELLISMYEKGLRILLERGKVAVIEPWVPGHTDEGSAGYPGLTFLQMLFGHRSFEELRHAFPDCWWDGDTSRVLLNILFPKKSSNVMGIM